MRGCGEPTRLGPVRDHVRGLGHSLPADQGRGRQCLGAHGGLRPDRAGCARPAPAGATVRAARGAAARLAAAGRVRRAGNDRAVGPAVQRRAAAAQLLGWAADRIGVVIARLTGGTERLSLRRWAGLLVGLAGVAVLAAPHLAGGHGWPIAEVLLVAIGYATAPLIAARKLADVPALPMTTACLSLDRKSTRLNSSHLC